MNFLPEGIPKFIIDKKIPPIGILDDVVIIEKPATEGVEELKGYLKLLL